MAVDPTNPATLYVGLSGGRILRSVDGGATWAPRGDFGEGGATDILIDPRNPANLFVGGSGVWASSDGGKGWTSASTGLPSNLVRGLAMDPTAPGTLYAATPVGVYKTLDGGASWFDSSSGLNTSFAIAAVAVDPNDPNVVYASNFEGLFKSKDAGASWVATGPTSKLIRKIAVDPLNRGTIYAGTSDLGLMRSRDDGLTFNKIGPDFLRAIRSFTIDPTRPGVLYAATDLGSFSRVYRTADGGDTWTEVGQGLGGEHLVQQMAADPSGSKTVFAATFGDGFWVSTDAGNTFAASNRGLVATTVISVAVDTSNTTPILYAGTFIGGGLFRSLDGGDSWIASNNGLTDQINVRTVAVDPLNPGTAFAGVSRNIFKSTDYGASWQLVLAHGGSAIGGFAFDTLRPGTIFGAGGTGVFKSVDAGLTWTRTNPTGDELTGVALDPLNTDTLYVSSQSLGIFKSVDGGVTFNQSNTGLTGFSLFVRVIAVHPRTPAVLYAATGDGIYKSVDAGALWNKLGGGLPATSANFVVIDPVVPANLYAATPVGVYKSSDSGATWSSLSLGLVDPPVFTLAVNRRTPNVIYAGLTNGGVNSLTQPVAGTTDPGSGVVVTPIDTNPNPVTENPTPVTVTFDQVTSGGATTVTTSGTGTPPPSGFKIGNPPVYYEISTTAAATGPITICINYTGIRFGNESKLKLHHNENGNWVDITTSLDTTNDIICGVVTSLSPFALFEPEPYLFKGFFSPVNNAPAVTNVKAGSSLPVKFSLSGNRGLNILKPGYPLTRSIPCSGGEPSEAFELTDTAGQSGLRYDASSDQYVYAWKTETSWKGTCRQFDLGLNDDSTRVIIVQFPNR